MSYQEYLMSADGSEILMTTIANPKGGIYTSDNNETGAIVIVFPPSWAGNMSKLNIDVLQLTDDLSFTILCKGQAPNGTWEKCSAHIIGDKSANNEVRFGYTGAGCAAGEEARACIVIGTVTSVWASPKVSISNFTEHGRDYDIGNVNINWEIHILKDLTGYVFDVDIPDALLDARGIVNQGDLATKNEADANVLNMTNAPAEAGADVTANHFTNSLATIDDSTNRAKAGLDSNGNLISKVIPGVNVSPSGAGLYFGADYLGYYDGSAWKAYMDNAGNFYLGGSAGNLQWDAASNKLKVKGTITSTDGNIGGFHIGTYDLWGGSDSIGDATTTIVIGNLDGTPKIALGPSADSITVAGTEQGFIVDGNGNLRAGDANSYLKWDGTNLQWTSQSQIFNYYKKGTADEIKIGFDADGSWNFYYGNKFESFSGVTTATNAGKLEDSSEDFIARGVVVGSRVYNDTDNTSTYVDAVDSATVLTLREDIMTSGEDYRIFPPAFIEIGKSQMKVSAPYLVKKVDSLLLVDATEYGINYSALAGKSSQGYGVFGYIDDKAGVAAIGASIQNGQSDSTTKEYIDSSALLGWLSVEDFPQGIITNESFTSDYDTAVSLVHNSLVNGTVVVTTTDGSTTYTEGTDYTIDYTNGTITVLSSGSMSNNTTYYIDYHYNYAVYYASQSYKGPLGVATMKDSDIADFTIGVLGEGRYLGGVFVGTQGQICLVPSARDIPTHNAYLGTFCASKNGHVYFCKGDGSPGSLPQTCWGNVWVQID